MSGRSPQRLVSGDVVIEDVDLDDEVVVVGGERLTNERAQRLADQIRHRDRGPGRRSLSGDGSHSPLVQFRVPAVLREQVEQRARDEGVPVSVLARRALQAYLDVPADPAFGVGPGDAAEPGGVVPVDPVSASDADVLRPGVELPAVNPVPSDQERVTSPLQV